jgi:hypothetical protein
MYCGWPFGEVYAWHWRWVAPVFACDVIVSLATNALCAHCRREATITNKSPS